MVPDLTLKYIDREAMMKVSDSVLTEDFTVALNFPYFTHVGFYVVTWMITEIKRRHLAEPVESSPAW